MSAIRFFTTALSVLASAASLVTAAPVVARDTQVPYFSPKNFASTGWGGDAGHANSGLRVYFPANGGIQELIANNGGLAAHDQQWTNGSFLSGPSFQVNDDAAIAASNTFAYGEDEIQVIFISSDMTIRSWEYSGGSWRLGELNSATPDFEGSLTANAYKTSNGPVTISVFYTHGDGYLEELQEQNGQWQYLDQIGVMNPGVAFTSMITHDGNNVAKRIFTADNQLYRWTTAAPTWTQVSGKTQFNAANLAVANLGNNQLRFFAAHGSPNQSVTQWTMNNNNFSPTPKVVAQEVLSSGSPVSVANQAHADKNWIYVFYLGPAAHLRCAMYDGTQWYVDDERVEV